MISELTKYIQDHANNWPIKLKENDRLTPLFRFNKEANGIVEKEEIGVLIFWFSQTENNPCLVTKIMDSSVSVAYIKKQVKLQEAINKKIGFSVFPIIYDVATVCGQPVLFQEAVNAPTYEMELHRAICDVTGNLSLLKEVVKRHFKEMGFLFKHLNTIDVTQKSFKWGSWAYDMGKKFKNSYDLNLDFISEKCLNEMRKEISSISLQQNYVLADLYSGNFFSGPRIVDQIGKLSRHDTEREPSIVNLILFIIAYLRTSPINIIYRDWLDMIACSIQNNPPSHEIVSSIRNLFSEVGFDLSSPKRTWALIMASFFVRVIDELGFHKHNIFAMRILKVDIERVARRLVEIQELIEKDANCDFSYVLRSEKDFVPVAKYTPPGSFGEPPYLIEEGLNGFNIILYRDQYYVLAQDLGPLHLMNVEESKWNEYIKDNKCFIGKSIEEARHFAGQFIKDNAKTDIALLTTTDFKKDEDIAFLKKEVLLKDESISQLNLAITDLDNKIKAAQQDLSENEATIAALEMAVKYKDGEIDKTNEELLALGEKKDELLLNIQKKDEDVGSLKKEVLFKDEEVAKLKKEIKLYDSRIEGAEAELSENSKAIEILRKDIIQKDEHLNSVTKKTEILIQEVSTLSSEVLKFKETVAALNKEIADKKEYIVGLETNLVTLRNYINVQKSILKYIKSRWWFKIFSRQYKNYLMAKRRKKV